MCSPTGGYPPLPPQCRNYEKPSGVPKDYAVETLEKHDDSLVSLLWKPLKALLQGRF
jgi:hypothetical protein